MLRYRVEGMSCGHCVETVTRAVKAVDPEAEVVVDLAQKRVTVENSAAKDAIAAAIRGAGYEAAGVV